MKILYVPMFHLYKGWIGSEWEVVDVANNNQRGTSERVREKMLLKNETDTQQGWIELANKTQYCGQVMYIVVT